MSSEFWNVAQFKNICTNTEEQISNVQSQKKREDANEGSLQQKRGERNVSESRAINSKQASASWYKQGGELMRRSAAVICSMRTRLR